jgi:hypothetical protein
MLVLVAGFVVGGVAIGLSILPSDGRPAPAGSPARASGAAASTATAAPISRRREGFLPIPNRTLAGAPTSVFVRRIGDDGDLVAWSPGDGALRSIRRLPGAFTGIEDNPQLISIAPDARSVLLVEAIGVEGRDHARLVTADGGIAWEGDRVTGVGGAAWSADSRVVAVANLDGWWLITIDRSGNAAAQNVSIDAAAAPIAPVGYSENGRWIYGASFDLVHGSLQPAVRVAIDGGRVERISAFGSVGANRLEARASGILDPATGRTVSYGANASIPGGPPTIEVKASDGNVAYRVTGGVTLGTLWTADGRLVVFDADGVPFPSRMRLRVVATDGTIEATPLDTGPVAGGGLIGAADGFVSLAFTTDRPDKALQLVVVRLDDGASSALVVPLNDEILGSGILR